MKVMVIIGTRPEAIKMAPVIDALRRLSCKTIVCATGQHREMLVQALEVFSIKPDIVLDVMRPFQSLNQLAAKLLIEIEPVLITQSPDWVLVQGDTTTAFCAGLSAFQLGFKVGHVEAGLRTGNIKSPFPEEANRVLLSRIAARHFTPTRKAREALLREGVPADDIYMTGNTIVDALESIRPILSSTRPNSKLDQIFSIIAAKPIVLITCHRRENFGDTLENICLSLKRLAALYQGHHWVFPVHLNPHVREPVMRILGGIRNLSLIDPIDYVDSLRLISRSTLIISDSGGIQEEAPSFGVPVVILRNQTERSEGISSGFATLAGQSAESIEMSVRSCLDKAGRAQHLELLSNPYGDGHAAERIARSILGQEFVEFGG